ncbi:unnamed protein product [Brassicogethes aeneus]|uniref:Neither inactivation nor afterpotential protein C n=1 Tax=Brassicogethes aeneus TaxID=1431903 RepID=A0A9P0B934_BRAAE|nr:unnamed protein product [Brassicogethes aeneus]
MKISKLDFNKINDPGNRFVLKNCFQCGVFGKIYVGNDNNSNRKVAVKVQKITEDNKKFIEREYSVLKDFSANLNIIDFYGVYKKSNEIWMVLEYCEGGAVIDLVNGLIKRNRRMTEEHIAHVLKETIKALIFLHDNNVIHRDIKARNILLTKEGDVKLADFGLCHYLKDVSDQTNTTIGSPCWMAPEVVRGSYGDYYGLRADVWSLGITAIELGDGKAPFQDMHPTRALFQIVRNPPPTLYRPSNWSQNYNDFINECLVKNQEHRPYIMEVIEHPFLEEIPDNCFHLSLELKSIIKDIGMTSNNDTQDYNILGDKLKRSIDDPLENMEVEDLAALDKINESVILDQLEARMRKGQVHTFIGDVLLIINPNEKYDIYGPKFHKKYAIKSRSENQPHIYAVADNAYQNAMHQILPQNIILTGESASGKTRNYLHLVDHLIHLGKTENINSGRILKAVKLIHALTHAATPFNKYSTRCVMKTELSFSGAGKITGGKFKVEGLEKWRISCVDMFQGNFHMLYYVFDGLKHTGKLSEYNLDFDVDYRYLRLSDDTPKDTSANVDKFKKIFAYLEEFDFTAEQIDTILKICSAVLILGEVRFLQTGDNIATLESDDSVKKVADLLNLESKKLTWALTNYVVSKNRSVVRRKNTSEEARDSRDVLANTIYQRLVDYIVEVINQKLEIGKAIFGDKYSVRLLDYFGFECFKQNHLPQLFINCLNEQIQYHYLQRSFSWEVMDTKGENIPYETINFYDNKQTLDQIMQKPAGVINLIDQTSRMGFKGKYILESIEKQSSQRLGVKNSNEFSVAHYTGKVTYDVREMPCKNRDFLPPEIIETLRLSQNEIVQQLFTWKLDKTGNLLAFQENKKSQTRFSFRGSKRDIDYSQIKRMRTASTVFRSISLQLLKDLSSNVGTYFVRCVQSNIKGRPNNFQREMVRQQIRALAVVETAVAKQCGYTYRMSFAEFLRRYKFLAFDFDENVDITKENCRLLLIRLNLEGWELGNSKVFLKYYNEEYLSRLYETHVRKIVKIQSILRGFLVKCKNKKMLKEKEGDTMFNAARRMSVMTEDVAAVIIQQAYRKKVETNEKLGEFKNMDNKTKEFIEPFAKKWRNKSIFQVLMRYRAAKIHDLFNFSQQVHLFNLNAYHNLTKINNAVDTDEVDTSANVHKWLGKVKLCAWKLNFHLNDIPFYDTSNMYDELTNSGVSAEKEESWDTPYRQRKLVMSTSEDSEETPSCSKTNADPLIYLAYNRDPEEKLNCLPESIDELSSNKFQKSNTKTMGKPTRMDRAQGKTNEMNKVNMVRETEYRKENTSNHYNTKPANKDFDYIKPTPVNRPKVSPIDELKDFGRRDSSASDDPPFNFQGMLRKTNFRKDSVKDKVIDSVRRFSLKKSEPIFVNRNGININEKAEFKEVSEELLPGMYIKGYSIDV